MGRYGPPRGRGRGTCRYQLSRPIPVRRRRPALSWSRVGGPVRNALTGAWSWFLVRAITLQGVGRLQAVAEVPVPYVMSLLSPVGEIGGLRINLERPDGTLLASLPHDELRIGQRS